MKKVIQKICRDITQQYKQDENVLGILFFGSAARNKFDQYSDVDFYILLNRQGKFSRRNFITNGLRVDVILNTKKEAREYLEEERNNVRRITSQMLAHGHILFQRKKNLQIIQVMAKKNLQLKTTYTAGEILMHKYSIDDFWGEIQRDVKGKDAIAFGLDSHLLVVNIIELFLKLNGEFLRQPNELREVLQSLDVKFSNQIEHFYKARSIQNKKQILSYLVDYIYTKSKGPLPKRWFLKE